MFNQIDISLNGKQLSSGGGATYAYKTYLQNLLNYVEEACNLTFNAVCFLKTMPLSWMLVLLTGLIPVYNPAVFVEQNTPFDLEGPILEDVCRLNRFVLNGVDVNLNLYGQNLSFCLMSEETNPNYKIVLTMSFSEHAGYRCPPESL